MNCYVFYSPLIEPLWRICSESIKAHTSFTLNPVVVPAEYDGAQYGEARYWKMNHCINAARLEILKQHPDEVMAFVGCDSEFFGDCVADLEERIKDLDYLAAENMPNSQFLCGCLQVIRSNPATVKFYEALIADPGEGRGPNDSLLNKYKHMIKWACLPRELYWNQNGCKCRALSLVELPKAAFWFHANFAIGTTNKQFLLEAARKQRLGS